MSGAEANGHGGPRPLNGFGPFQALPALTDVQRRGMDAASQVIKGFIDLLDVQPPLQPADPDIEPVNGHQPGFAQLRTSVARALDLYNDLVRRSFESYADLMEQTLRARGVQLHAADDGQATLLTVQGIAGAQAKSTVWLHNTTDRPASAVLRLTGLTAHDGLVVPASAGRFEPTAVGAPCRSPGVGPAERRLAARRPERAPGTRRVRRRRGRVPASSTRSRLGRCAPPSVRTGQQTLARPARRGRSAQLGAGRQMRAGR